MDGMRSLGARASLLILLAALVVRAGLAVLTDRGPGSLYLIHESVARSLLEGRGFSSLVSGQEGASAPFITYPPGFSIVIAAATLAAGQGAYSLVRMLMIVCGSLSCLALAQATAWAFSSRRLGIRAGAALALLPTVAVLDVLPDLNATFPLFFLLLSLMLWFSRERGGWREALASGLCLGIGSMFRTELTPLLPAMALGSLFSGRFARGPVISAVLFSLGGLLAISPWAIRNYRTFGVLTPSGPGTGLYLVDMIGKTYPDPAHGFAYGDDQILAAEGGVYTDLHWPRPYERDRERLHRALVFMRAHPGMAAWAFIRNLPLAWFGHQLYLSRDIPSLQMEVSAGRLLQTLRDHPMGVLDRLAGMLISLTVLVLGIRGIIGLRGGPKGSWPFLLVAGYYFAAFALLGLLGRYTLTAYVMLLPYAAAGLPRSRRSSGPPGAGGGPEATSSSPRSLC